MAKIWTPKLDAKQYSRIKEGEWFEFVDFKQARAQYQQNIDDCRRAVEEYNEWPRPLRILAVHGSGRSSNNSCAYEASNSKMFLQESLEIVNEIDSNIGVEQISLRDYNIEPCNNCVSTTSPLCGFPCDCIDENEMILTDNGWIPIKETKDLNHKVLDGSGRLQHPLFYFDKGEKNVFKIKTIEGYEITATADHKIYLDNNKMCPLENLQLGDKIKLILPENPIFSTNRNLPINVTKINNIKPTNFNPGYKTRKTKGKLIEKQPGNIIIPKLPKQWTLALGESMGYILGDGTICNIKEGGRYNIGLTSSIEDSNDAKKVMSYITKINNGNGKWKICLNNTSINGYTYKNRKTYEYKTSGKILIEFFNALGLSKDQKPNKRRLPSSLWTAPEIAVRGFLRGIFATDGTIFKRKGYNNCIVTLYSVSEGLLQDIQKLLIQYGIRSAIFKPSKRTCYQLSIISKYDVSKFKKYIGFANKRKQQILNKHQSSGINRSKTFVRIKEIIPVGKRNVCDISMPFEHNFCAGGIKVSNCFPFDPMQELYPKILRADILFCSTGVNQSTMSTRLKAFCDRMISLDGGFFREGWKPKDGEFKDKMLALAASTNIAYDQRLYGRVGGYFISTKDELNNHPTINQIDHEKRAGKSKYDPSMAELTSYTLRDGMEAYGYFHPVKYYAVAAADPDVDYMYDKQYMNEHPEIFEDGKEVIRQSIQLALELKENLPKFVPDRFNRT